MSDKARVTVRVAAPREIAFSVFTEEIDGWWRHGKKFRMGEPSVMSLEPRPHGKLQETVRTASGHHVYDLGEVLVWQPPERLVLSWRAVNFGPSDPSTEVEVTFERAVGYSGEGTLVTVEHRGWDKVRPDHPVRHGQAPSVFIVAMARWWGDLMSSLREGIAETT